MDAKRIGGKIMNGIVLNEKQERGLAIAVDRYCNKEKYTVISGYA